MNPRTTLSGYDNSPKQSAHVMYFLFAFNKQIEETPDMFLYSGN